MSDWKEWSGDIEMPCILEDDDIVEVEYRNGGRCVDKASNFYWGYHGVNSDIVRFCRSFESPIIKPEEYSDHIYKEMKDTLDEIEAEHTGGSVSYYDVTISKWTNPKHQQKKPVTVSCNDIIESLEMNYAQGNAFKALWRIAAAKQGKLKKGNNTGYDAEKVCFFGDRILKQESPD